MNTSRTFRPALALAALLIAAPALHAEDAPPPAAAPEPPPKIIIPRDLDTPDQGGGSRPAISSPSTKVAVPSVPLAAGDQQFWTIHWKRIAMLFAHVEDHIYAAPNFDPKFPSSAHTTAERYIADHTTEQKVSGGGVSRTVTHQPAREEAVAAAQHLPDFSPGSYGYIHSAKVVQIVGPTEMIVTEIQLIDPKEITQAKETLARAKQIAAAEQQEQQRIQQEEARRRQLSNNRDTVSTTSNSNATRDVERDFKLNYEVRQKIADLQEKQKAVQLRVVGFSTAALTAGSTWRVAGSAQGAQLVLVADDKPAGKAGGKGEGRGQQPVGSGGSGSPGGAGNPGSSGRTAAAPPTPAAHHFGGGSARNANVLALSAELFSQAPTEAQFDKVLAEANLTRPAFCQLAHDIMKSNKGDDRPVIVLAIETERKKSQAAAAKESAGAAAAPGSRGSGKASDDPTSFSNKYKKKDAAPPTDAAPK